MGDRSFKNKLRLFKHRRRHTRFLGKLGRLPWIAVAAKPHQGEIQCQVHPNHRWLRCDKVWYKSYSYRRGRHTGWVMCYGYWCMGCYGNTCPHCGRQMRVKRRMRSRNER